jgi:hypothetical protein
MNTPFYKHPQFAKWGLYSLLLASLGFTVSMNPDHYNNIARHYPKNGFNVVHLAAEMAPGTKVPIQVIPTLSNGEVVNRTSLYKGHFYSRAGSSCADLQQFDGDVTVGETREFCNLANSPSDLNALGRELNERWGTKTEVATATTATTATSADVTEESTEPETEVEETASAPVETTESTIAKAAKPCNDQSNRKMKTCNDAKAEANKSCSSYDSQSKNECRKEANSDFATCKHEVQAEVFSCHSDKIVWLSELENAREEHVYGYYQKYMRTQFKNILEASVLTQAMGPDGNLTYVANENAREMHEKGDEVYAALVGGLSDDTGTKVRKEVIAVYQKAFEAQAKHAQEVAIEGVRQNNPAMLRYGYDRINTIARTDYANFYALTMGGLDSLGNDAMKNYFMRDVYRPLGSWLNDISTNSAAQGFDKIAIPGLTGVTYAGGVPNLSNDIIQARIAAESARTNNLASLIGTQGATFNGQGQVIQQIPYIQMPGNQSTVGGVPSPLQQQNGNTINYGPQQQIQGTLPRVGTVPPNGYGRY